MSKPNQPYTKAEFDNGHPTARQRPWFLWTAVTAVSLIVITIMVVAKISPDEAPPTLTSNLDISALEKMSAEEIIKDPEALKLATIYSNKLFREKCETCHGPEGKGLPGHFPNLTDDDWLHGGTTDDIIQTITYGRESVMSSFSGSLGLHKIDKLVNFVASLNTGEATQTGWMLFDEAGCSGCHGKDAKGNKYVGSANLTDDIWRFGGSKEEIRRTITGGVNQQGVTNTRYSVMPSWKNRLTEQQIKLLAVRVWGFGGGQPMLPAWQTRQEGG